MENRFTNFQEDLFTDFTLSLNPRGNSVPQIPVHNTRGRDKPNIQ